MTRRSLAVAAVAIASGVASAAARPPKPRIEQLSWLAGCWEARSPQRTVEEHWLSPRGGTMLGTGRTVRDGRTVEYEFVLLREDNGELAYEAHPSGQPSAVFRTSAIDDAAVVFENAEHDFPQRVGYEIRGADSLLAWIDGKQNGQSRRIEFPYTRVPCAAAEPR